ncbi:LysE family translocator [Paenibacillus sp. NEAU-GSW1]|uniref:LysE family translocator n=1 Tax=Paenibacillus sp. NEAU-GSW1 TaxID=2682486 RepID=UPI0012E1F0E1|nr:LysE family translocator [Paenibacillus sp. NEAU-GSW1]MUT65183.1 LysE family translocator [Paenibacillus sp. NEAU-GSW1]
MFGIEHYSIFILSGIMLNITPGSDTLYILGRTISQGRRAGLVSVMGIVTGALLHTLMAALGLSILLVQSAIAFTIVKWLGAAYLIYLGIRAIMSKESGGMTVERKDAMLLRNIYWQGMLTNVLNPKVALFYLAFLPQFIAPDHHYGAIPFLILGLTFIINGTVWCVILVLASEMMAKTVRKSRLSGYLNKIMGGIFILLGLKLLRESRA